MLRKEQLKLAENLTVGDVRQLISDKNIKFKEGKELTDEECLDVLSFVIAKIKSESGDNMGDITLRGAMHLGIYELFVR